MTINLPKPLVSVNNKPIINFLIEKIVGLKKKFPVEQVTIVSNNKFYSHFLEWKSKYSVDAEIVNDGSNTPEDRLGAIGDIRLVINKTAGDWLVLGGDNLFEDDLVGFVDFALKVHPSPVVGLYEVGDKSLASRYGVVKLDSNKRIVELKEKPKTPSSTLVASCVYYFPNESLSLLNDFSRQGHTFDAAGEYIRWLVGKTEVLGYTFTGKWMDIGHYDSLKEAEKYF